MCSASRKGMQARAKHKLKQIWMAEGAEAGSGCGAFRLGRTPKLTKRR